MHCVALIEVETTVLQVKTELHRCWIGSSVIGWPDWRWWTETSGLRLQYLRSRWLSAHWGQWLRFSCAYAHLTWNRGPGAKGSSWHRRRDSAIGIGRVSPDGEGWRRCRRKAKCCGGSGDAVGGRRRCCGPGQTEQRAAALMVLLALLKRPCPSALSQDGLDNHDPHAPSGVGPLDDTRTEQRFHTFPFPLVRLRHCSPTKFAKSCGLPIGCVHRIVRGLRDAAVVPESVGARWSLERTRDTQRCGRSRCPVVTNV